MFLGKDGFIWWIGVIEDIEDELLLGRAKVRIFGYHPDFDSGRLPTEDLPWATVIMPANIPNAYGRLELGDWVFGFFLDATESNEPAILGYIPGIPAPNAKNFGRYKKSNRSFYNTTQSTANSHSIITRSGHFLQFVDTPGSESIILTHKNRNSISISANNTIVINHTKGPRITLDDSGITGQLRMEVSNTIANTSTVSTMNCNALSMIACSNGTINIQRGNSTIRMLQNGNVEIVANTINFNASNTINLTSNNVNINATQNVRVTGQRVDLN
jgi:hypothetical protein